MSGSENEDQDEGTVSETFGDEEEGSRRKRRSSGRGNEENEMDEEERKYLEAIVPCLANRAFHLPGNGWCQDWFQYVFANNHAFFSLFCAHKDHPVTKFERILVFLSSLVASLAISNGFYIVFLIKDDGYLQDTQLVGEDLVEDGVTYANYEVAVITLGALLHTLFDLTIWTLAACGCCEAGGCLSQCQKFTWSGTVTLGVIFIGTSVLTVMLLLLYGTIENSRLGVDPDADANYTTAILDQGFAGIDLSVAFSDAGNADSNKKWTTWLKQLVISLFVYDIVISTILFTGVFGCLQFLPIIGSMFAGRPLEIKEEEKAKRKAERKKRRKAEKLRKSRRASTAGSETGSNASD